MRYCPNVSCPGRVLEGIVHFASRDAMDIRGLGYERVRQLLDDQADPRTWPTSIASPPTSWWSWSASPGSRPTSWSSAIEASKERPLSLLLFGLGIRHVGKTVAVLLARRFGSLDALTWRRARTSMAGSRGSGP